MSGLPPLHDGFGPLPLPWVRHVTTPHMWREGLPGESEDDFTSRLASELDRVILEEGPETIAAFIAEPVMGAGGVMPPPRGYHQAVQAVLRKYGILYIADEVITGFGRIGKRFGSEVFGIEPDLVSVAKALTSSYIPMGAALVTLKVADVIAESAHSHGQFAHGYTYGE